MLHNSRSFENYRPQQLQICWDFLYDENVDALLAGTTRRFGKTFIVTELVFLTMLSALDVIDLGSVKMDELKERNSVLGREFNVVLAAPVYDQISRVYRKGSIPLAAAWYRAEYPHVEIVTPLSGELLRMHHNGRTIRCQAGGLEPRSAEYHRGSGADVLFIDEVASADWSIVEQIYMPMLEDSQGLLLTVGSAQAVARKAGQHTEVAGFSKVRKLFQKTPRFVFYKFTIDDAINDDGSLLLDKKRILERHGWDEDHPIFAQEYMVDDEVIPAQGLFRLWNRWKDEPWEFSNPKYGISADIGYADAYAVTVWAFEGDKANVVAFKEYTQTSTEDILADLYPLVSELTDELDWLFLPHDSLQKHAKTTMTDYDVWNQWTLSPPKKRTFVNLRNTEENIRRVLNVINKCRTSIEDSDQQELFEERVKNATFSLGTNEIIHHDKHSHMAHSICYGILGMCLAGILKDPVIDKPKSKKLTAEEHRLKAFQRAMGE